MGETEVKNSAIGVVKGSVFCSGTLYVCAWGYWDKICV